MPKRSFTPQQAAQIRKTFASLREEPARGEIMQKAKQLAERHNCTTATVFRAARGVTYRLPLVDKVRRVGSGKRR